MITVKILYYVFSKDMYGYFIESYNCSFLEALYNAKSQLSISQLLAHEPKYEIKKIELISN